MGQRSTSAILIAFLLSVVCSTWSAPVWAAPPSQAGGSATEAAAQEDDAPRAPERFRSPRATMFTFLDAMERAAAAGLGTPSRAEALASAVECLNLSRVPRDAGPEIAVRLLGILNRIGRIEPFELPDAESVERRGVERVVYFPRSAPAYRRLLAEAPDAVIEFARGANGAWKFSAETVAGVGDFYRRVEHLGTVYGVDEASLSLSIRLQRVMPESLRGGEFLALEKWQWLGLLVLTFLAVVADVVVQALLRVGAAFWLRRRGARAERETLKRAMRPFGLLAGAMLALGGLWLLGLPPAALAVLLPAVRLVLMVAGVWAAFRVTDLASEVVAKRAFATDTKIDDLLVPLVRKTAKIFIFAMGLVYIASSLEIDILPLVTGLGIGGLAIAFAAKDTIENFFGSIAVILDRPFEVGDWVKTGDTEGTVEELGFRSTRIRTFYNSLVTAPNATLVRAVVDNYGRRKYRRFTTHLGVAYDTPPDKVEAFCEGIRELIREHPYTRKDYYHVYFHEYGDSALKILVYMFFEAPDWSVELRERHRLLVDIYRLADRLGVEFAFPTQTLYLKRGEGMEDHEAAEAPRSDASAEAERAGRAAAAAILEDASWRRDKPGAVAFSGPSPVADPDDDSQVESRIGGDA